jgi:two-component system, OmpR family, alkaline phosphatase synthesis response regulator PhoP
MGDLDRNREGRMAATSLAVTPNTTIIEQRHCPAQRIMVIAENRPLRTTLHRLFTSEGYEVEMVADDLVGLEMVRKKPPSALILDLRYPASGGWGLCREIAQSAPNLPFVILSTNSDVVEKILLLEIGAGDCIIQPFQPRELLARVRCLIRLTTLAVRKQIYVFESVVVDFVTMNVTRGGEEVPLTPMELKTLEFMTKHAHQVVSRDDLLHEVWGYQNYSWTRTVDNHILRLRRKLENNPAEPRHFLTIHGVGYKFEP